MKTLMTFLNWAKHRAEAHGRTRLWAALRTMDPAILARAGLMPELLDQGPDAWPWQGDGRGDRVKTDMPIDARGAPVPIAPTDRLSGIAAGERPHPVNPDVRHRAA